MSTVFRITMTFHEQINNERLGLRDALKQIEDQYSGVYLPTIDDVQALLVEWQQVNRLKAQIKKRINWLNRLHGNVKLSDDELREKYAAEHEKHLVQL